MFDSLNSFGLKRKLSQVVLVKLMGVALGFLVTVVMARALGAAELGVYTYAFTVVMIASVLSRLGFDNLIIRRISSLRPEKKFSAIKSLLRSSTIATTGMSLIIGCVGGWYFYDIVDKANAYRYTLIIGLLLVLPLLSIAYIQRANLNGLKLAALSELPITVIRHLLVIVVVFVTIISGMTYRAEEMMLLTAMVFAVVVILGYFLVSRSLPGDYRDSKGAIDLVSWSRQSLPFMIINASNTLNQRLDILFLGLLSTPSQVGVYAVVSRLLPAISFASGVVNTTLKPHISELYSAGDRKPLQSIIFSTSIAVFGFTAGVSLLLAFFGAQILSIFGDDFIAGYIILLILLVGKIVAVLSGPVAIVLVMCDQQKLVSTVELISNVFYAVLLLLLVKSFGAVGAAIATSSVWICRNAVLFYFVYSRLRLNTSIFNFPSWRAVFKRGAGKTGSSDN